MLLELGYGNGVQTVEIPEKNLLEVLVSNPVEHERYGEEAVKFALENPIGSKKLREMAGAGQRVVIVTSDITRPLPSHEILPLVLDELYEAGVAKEDITVVLALGSHRKHTEEEKARLAGELCPFWVHRKRDPGGHHQDCGRSGFKNLPGEHRVPLFCRLFRRGKGGYAGMFHA